MAVRESGDRPRRLGRRATVIGIVLATLAAVAIGEAAYRLLFAGPPADGTVTVDLSKPVNTFEGTQALGAGVDGLEKDEIDKVWTPDNIEAMRSAGYGPISFRLRTELGVKAWHWNAEGSFSDAANQQGYWTSSSQVGKDAGVSYGYDLPRRGNTVDHAKNNGYSRLVDGDQNTYWKSNPYLDTHFTEESNAKHPQWMMIAFTEPRDIDTIRIAWGNPYATRFRVQYWTGKDAVYNAYEDGDWKDFPEPSHAGRAGTQTVRVAARPTQAMFLRILLTDASGTAEPGSRDVRDRLGFAVRELSAGRTEGGTFIDEIQHQKSNEQTALYTSSTDPWHRASDIDTNYEHASFERTYASGLTNGQPVMVPVPVLYGIPEDAAALLRYLRSRNFPVSRIEMGEEPNGQLAEPEHYAELYRQVGRALRAEDPKIELGGPGYQTELPVFFHWPDAAGNRSYTSRFVASMRDHDALGMFNFYSFQWYPFDDVCADPVPLLAKHPGLLADLMRREEDAGLPKEVPKVIAEYGYSPFAARQELEMPGSIVNSETVAQFLAVGGDVTYFYGLEPNWVFQENEGKPCDNWGNLMLFQFYDDFKIRPIATYHALQLVTQQWVAPEGGKHTVYPAATAVPNNEGQPLVTAYAVGRPDGRIAVLAFNKDPSRSVNLKVQLTGQGPSTLPGPVEIIQYSGEQWRWYDEKGQGSGGFPEVDEPPARTSVPTGQASVSLPPYSISVLRSAPS